MEENQTKIGFGKAFVDGLYLKNPLLSLSLGLTLAVLATSRVEEALIVSLIVLVSLFCSQLVLSLLRKHLDRVGAFLLASLVSAGISTIALILFDNLMPSLISPKTSSSAIVLYGVVPFVSTSSLVLAKSEDALSRPLSASLGDALGSGMGYLLVLTIISLFREIISTGAISFVFQDGLTYGPLLWDRKVFSISLFGRPFGGFFCVALWMSLHGWILNHQEEKRAISLQEGK